MIHTKVQKGSLLTSTTSLLREVTNRLPSRQRRAYFSTVLFFMSTSVHPGQWRKFFGDFKVFKGKIHILVKIFRVGVKLGKDAAVHVAVL